MVRFIAILLAVQLLLAATDAQQNTATVERRRRKGAGPGEWGPPARDRRDEFFPPPPHFQQDWSPGGPGGPGIPGGVPPHEMHHGMPPPPPLPPHMQNMHPFVPGPLDKRTEGMTKMHANMRSHVRERSDHYLGRVGQSPTLQPDEKTAITKDIEELHTLETELINSREKMMMEFESLREIPDDNERNQKMEAVRHERLKGHHMEEQKKQRIALLRQSIDQRLSIPESERRGGPGLDP